MKVVRDILAGLESAWYSIKEVCLTPEFWLMILALDLAWAIVLDPR